jgi:quinol monooxygenase YgiN
MDDEEPREVDSLDTLLSDRMGLVVRLVANPGGRPAVLDCLHRYADRLDEEPGTEAFVINLDPDESDVVWLLEWFSGEQAMVDHRSSDAFADMSEELATLLAAPPGLVRMDPLRVHLQGVLIDSSL